MFLQRVVHQTPTLTYVASVSYDEDADLFVAEVFDGYENKLVEINGPDYDELIAFFKHQADEAESAERRMALQRRQLYDGGYINFGTT